MLSRTDDEIDVDEDFVEGVCHENSDGSEPNSEDDAVWTPRARKTKRTGTMHPTPKKRMRSRRLKEISIEYFSETHHSADQRNLSCLV